MLSFVVAPVSFSPQMVVPSAPTRAVAPRMLEIEGPKPWVGSTEISDKAGMVALAEKLNPVIGFWDPLNIVNADTRPETIGWFRHAEIKHGRVAMAAFVGYCIQSNGIYLPWNLQGPVTGTLANTPIISHATISAAGGPADQWDALPTPAKLQILGFIGFLEMWSETSTVLEMDGQKHYVRGGKPGYFPSLKGKFPHPVPLNLFDPFGFSAKMTPERKEKGLITEINNGRLAMIGIMGFVAEAKVPGSVPGLDSLNIKPYAGEVMAPFAAGDVELPMVKEMLANSIF
uniref:Light harvesting protein n=1 Tax=Coccolithus braarudii TaxID=221442 RepID=A0A7S0L9K6_9EUKA